MRETIKGFEPIHYFAPDGRGDGGTNAVITPQFLHGLDDDTLRALLTKYNTSLGDIDLSSPRGKARAIGAIMQEVKRRPAQEETISKPPFHERVSSAIVTDEDRGAVDAIRGIWDHMRHNATDPRPNGHFTRDHLPFQIPQYPLTRINDMEERLGTLIEGNIAGRRDSIPLALQIDGMFDALDYKRRQVIQDPTEAERFDELALLGIDPRHISVSWGEIHKARIVPTYHAVRGQEGDPERVGDMIQARRGMVDHVLPGLDRQFSNFFRHNPDVTQQALLRFFRDRPRSDRYGEDELIDEQEAFAHMLADMADKTLAERVGVPVDRLPLSYGFLSSWQDEGVITPQYPTLETMNRNIRNGEQIDLYCCPNYARYTREDGVEVYTFDGLEPGLGLTAERSFPFVAGLIDRVGSINNHPPVNMRIGIADFEATQANADMVKLSVDGFKGVLGQSVEQMIAYFQERYGKDGSSIEVVRLNDEAEPLGEWQVTIKKQGIDVASLSFGAITKTYEGKIEGYTQENFDVLVQAKREELAARALTDTAFQHVLDEGLTTRLGIMLDWPNGKENDQVKELAGMYNAMTETNFAQPLLPEGIFTGLIETINTILERSDLPENEKDMIVRDITLKWLQQQAAVESTDTYNIQKPVTQALQGIRARTAEQLAEYAVMSILMKRAGTGVHFTADATAMWEMSGKALKSSNITTPRMHMKGGYEGA